MDRQTDRLTNRLTYTWSKNERYDTIKYKTETKTYILREKEPGKGTKINAEFKATDISKNR